MTSHLKKMRAGRPSIRLLKQTLGMTGSKLPALSQVEGPSLKTRIGVDWRKGLLFILGVASCSGSQVMAMNQSQNNQLREAATKGNVSEIERLLAAGTQVDAQVYDGSGATPLFMAVNARHEEACKVLLENDANVDAVYGEVNKTPLLNHAIRKSTTAIVRLLLQYYPRLEVRDSKGNNPLLVAAFEINPPMCKLIVQNCEEYRIAIKTLLLCLNRLKVDSDKSAKIRTCSGELYRNFARLIKPHLHYIRLSQLLTFKNSVGFTAYDLFPIECLRPRTKLP